MLLKQTKIVASISDRRCDVDFIKQLFEAGMNVVRMNTAHASREGFEALIANVRAVSNRIAILMDTKGPEVRTTANAEPIPYKIGEKVKIVGNPDLETTRECIAVSYPNFVSDLNIGGTILIDDGDLELEVIDKTDGYLLCEVKNDATLGSRKSVNVPGVRINKSFRKYGFTCAGLSHDGDGFIFINIQGNAADGRKDSASHTEFHFQIFD